MFGFLSLLLVILAVLFGLRWAAELWRRPAPPLEGAADAPRFERVESALAALEGRLERLEEQQQFLERLLTERPRPEALPPVAEPAEEAGAGGADSILFDTDRGDG